MTFVKNTLTVKFQSDPELGRLILKLTSTRMSKSPVDASKASEDKQLIFKFNASLFAYAHMVCAYLAFLAALIVGSWLHYHKIVQNALFGYPDEWFPSVSASIGDRYPERSIFQLLIALTAGPRFLLILYNFIKLYKKGSVVPYITLVAGLVRTFACGGFVYVTSTDDHEWHDPLHCNDHSMEHWYHDVVP